MASRPASWLLIAMLTLSISIVATERPDADKRERWRKRAWEWTLEERLVQRFDPSGIQERETAYRAAHGGQLGSSPSKLTQVSYSAENVAYRIDGRRNPELFLPHELFDSLVTGLVPDIELRTKQRVFFESKIRAFGFDADLFWAELSSVSQEYVSVKYDNSRVASPVTAHDHCRARFLALQAARRSFGHNRFEQFLYEVIAPSKQMSSVTGGSDPASQLRDADKGCS